MSSLTLVTLFALSFKHVSANFLSDALPQPGASPQDQIKCYALPYGALGFSTHILTYYTITMLTTLHSPWRWKHLTHYKFDLFLALVGLPFTIGPSVLTMIRCRSHWPFYCLAAWKLSLSLMLAGTTITSALKIRQGINNFNRGIYAEVAGDKYQAPHGPVFEVSIFRTILGGLLYGAGTVGGFVGLAALIIQAWSDNRLLRHLSYGAIGLFLFIAAIGLLLGYCFSSKLRFITGIGTCMITAGLVFGAGAAIYSDWALAAIAGNMVGLPDGNNWVVDAVFWTYFAAKRLPMASM